MGLYHLLLDFGVLRTGQTSNASSLGYTQTTQLGSISFRFWPLAWKSILGSLRAGRMSGHYIYRWSITDGMLDTAERRVCLPVSKPRLKEIKNPFTLHESLHESHLFIGWERPNTDRLQESSRTLYTSLFSHLGSPLNSQPDSAAFYTS